MTHDHVDHCEPPARRRRAGLLLPVASLTEPGFGQSARDLLDFLARAGLSVWQVLPLGPTHADGSPYQCLSSFALEPSLLDERDLGADPAFDPGRSIGERRNGAGASRTLLQSFDAFRRDEADWLDDYCRFVVLRAEQGGRPWMEWPAELRDREPSAMRALEQRHDERLRMVAFEQFLLDRQWRALREQAGSKGICLFGDLPIFVAGDSADVWANRALFDLDATGRPNVVAGVPPDYFSQTGQRWGNPLFDFARMQDDGFAWWRSRLARHLALYDWVRIDHFRAFSAYWEIPVDAADAVTGRWIDAPGDALLTSLRQISEGELPLVAEDLGVITPEVTALRDRFGLPGMVVLQFAFDGHDDNPHRPDHHREHAVVYTGTHDNDTSLGWWFSLEDAERARVRRDLDALQGIDPAVSMPDALVESALASPAALSMLPVADLLGLGSEARINVPGTCEGNWTWRLPAGALTDARAVEIRARLAVHDRLI